LTEESPQPKILRELKVNNNERANPPKGGDAKPRVYSRKAMIAGLPTIAEIGSLGDDV